MRWVPDATGRFPRRPHYEPGELDLECEALVEMFLRAKYGRVAYPLSTDDLTVLLEQQAGDLDLYADLRAVGPDVEGMTEFVRGSRPRVRVARELSEDARREPRLRTTLAHELGHVRLHDFLWWFDQGAGNREWSARCREIGVLGARGADWLEWQAGYAAGAVLMPRSALGELVGESAGPVASDAAAGRALARRVAGRFGVTTEAARVRLARLGYVEDPPRGRGRPGRARPWLGVRVVR